MEETLNFRVQEGLLFFLFDLFITCSVFVVWLFVVFLVMCLVDEVFVQCRTINASGVAILMVEQNARRCLQVVNRGYVLDQGRNAYTGTGRELLGDPNVIELYLGTLAKATGG